MKPPRAMLKLLLHAAFRRAPPGPALVVPTTWEEGQLIAKVALLRGASEVHLVSEVGWLDHPEMPNVLPKLCTGDEALQSEKYSQVYLLDANLGPRSPQYSTVQTRVHAGASLVSWCAVGQNMIASAFLHGLPSTAGVTPVEGAQRSLYSMMLFCAIPMDAPHRRSLVEGARAVPSEDLSRVYWYGIKSRRGKGPHHRRGVEGVPDLYPEVVDREIREAARSDKVSPILLDLLQWLEE